MDIGFAVSLCLICIKFFLYLMLLNYFPFSYSFNVSLLKVLLFLLRKAQCMLWHGSAVRLSAGLLCSW